MTKKRPSFDYRACMACRACDIACPLSCIAMGKADLDAYRKAYPCLGRADACTGCGICASACPVGAIAMI